MMLMFVIIGLGLGPMAIDGFTQLLTSYESTNTMRIITGFPAASSRLDILSNVLCQT